MFRKLIASKTMRRRVSWIIAAVLILPFILFFHATGRAPATGPGGAAGIMFGKRISWETFEEQRRWLRQQLEQRFGESLPEAMEPMVVQATWDRLMLLEHAQRSRVRVNDQELARNIQQIPLFQEEGTFFTDRYHRALRAMGTNPQAFEQMVRNELQIQQMVERLKHAITVSDEEVRTAYLEEQEQLGGTLIWFNPDSYSQRVLAAITEEDLHAYYDAHQDDVRIPEQLTIEYAGASREELAARTQPSEDALRAFYDAHQEEFSKDDRTTTPFEDIRDTVRERVVQEQARKQLNALAIDLEEDLKNALPFEEIVKTRALTARSTGPFDAHAGWVADGPPAELLEALKDLLEGTLSGVIETPAGVYLGRVTQRVPSRVPTLDDVRTTLMDHLTQAHARAEAKAAADAFHQRLSQHLASGLRFEEAMLQEPPPSVHHVTFTRTQPIEPVGVAPSLNAAAFAMALGAMSDVQEVPTGFAIIRPETRLPPDESALIKEADRIRESVLTRKQSEQLERWLTDLRTRANLKSYVE